MGESYTLLGVIYFDLQDNKKSISYYQQGIKCYEKPNKISEYASLSAAYIRNNQLDSSKYYIQLAYNNSIEANYLERLSTIFRVYGWIEIKSNNNQLALDYFKKGVQEAFKFNNYREASFNYNEIARLFQKMNETDSCIHYAFKGLTNAQLGPYNIRILESSTLLSEAFKTKKDFKQAYEYQELMVKTKESLFGAGSIQAMQTIIADDEARRKEIEVEKKTYQNKLRQYGLLTGLGIMLLIGIILYRNNRQKQKANIVLQEQKNKVESTLSTLKSTQSQLIQKEKLASLGELTAGIAHEIQNPLNFVNNFSELSIELIEESPLPPNGGTDESWIPDTPFGGWGAFLTDLRLNLQKINHHGKRASSIVKGMLEHSRQSTGERELTDINQLADEYLRLAYHGLRAKDSDGSTLRFNSDYELIADENLPKINVIPQDIGRVLLNLINNAFWAVKTVEKPLVIVKTEQTENQLIIKVTDNGVGMTDEVKAKIFQPFFTTKPTGQGTGLGLSLAYDIVTKGHGGTIEVESVEGEGTTFVVKLPIV
jgi:signal transduction histidine kinase